MGSPIIPSLDGIRMVAVFIVLLSHAGLGHLVPGGFGVTLFFFLSGYLITTLLIAEYEDSQDIHLSHFFVRRFFRLFPPLLLTLSITYLLVYLGVLGGGMSWEGVLSQIFYLANYHAIFDWPGEIPAGTGVLWSLAVEEHFYLFFPFLFLLLMRRYDKRTVAFILLGLCAAILLWRCALVFYYESSAYRTYYATDTRIDSIIYGCVLALAWNPANRLSNSSMNWREWTLLALSLFVLLLCLVYRNPQFRETFRYSLQGLALMPVFYLAIRYHKSIWFSVLNSGWMKRLGVYSYFIYLSHHVVIYALEEAGITNSPIVMITLTCVICIAYSAIMDRYVDVYFRKLRKAFR